MKLSSAKIDQISKEEFLAAYNKHLPNAWTKLAFKYFSESTKPEDKFVKKIFMGIELSLFGIGMIGAMANASNAFLGYVSIPFGILLALIAVFMFGAFIMNNSRIRKIRNILGLTIEEYNTLALLYVE